MSVCVGTESVLTEVWGWRPLLTGVAFVDAVLEVTGIQAGLKWPNDVTCSRTAQTRRHPG
jgi:BirA family biotin operon repressor/biotin-[acetyl-CoA-carboxylase] ligase